MITNKLSNISPLLIITVLYLVLSMSCAFPPPWTDIDTSLYTSSYPGCIKPNHISQAQLNQALINYYAYWKNTYVKQSNGNTPGGGYYIRADSTGEYDYPIKSNSEAHGFGMIIFALAGDKIYFDGLYNMYDKHRSTINSNNMSWVITEEEYAYQDSDSAADGDMDIAYALLLAHDRWGSAGSINYLEEAERIITDGIKQSDMSSSSKRTKLGDWDNTAYDTRSSDWMTDHMHAYYAATGDAFWLDAIQTVYQLIEQITDNYAPDTGLMPDFVVDNPPEPAAADFLEGENDGNYYYNACRYPWRIAMDYAMTGSAEAKNAANKMINWLKAKTGNNPYQIKSGYSLAGDALPGSNYFSAAFAAPFIAACVVDNSHQAYLNKGWDAINNQKESYYEDSINLLCMFFISGNWWKPGSDLNPEPTPEP